MRDVACDVCGSSVSELYAVRPPRGDVLHRRFVRCVECGFVYADPRATSEEAERFYNAVSDRGSGSLAAAVGSSDWRRAVGARRRHLERAVTHLGRSEPVRFLEIGFGDGSGLAAAQELGWEAHGLEYADWLVTAVAERLRIPTLRRADITDAGFDEATFDVVYAWHVVEHVLDIDQWLAGIGRVLRPGGILVLGTENAESVYGLMWRGAFRLARRVPWPPTSTDHTYWFSCNALAAVTRRHSLEPVSMRAYENRPLEIIRGESLSRLRNPRWALTLALYLSSSVLTRVAPRFGGKIELVARKLA